MPDARIVFTGAYKDTVGEEEYLASLAPLLQRYADRLTFMDLLSDTEMASFFSLCDVLAVTSLNSTEAFGMVQVEAMLEGTPVVASDLPGVREAVRRTGMGEIVPPRDSAALAAAVVRVLQRRQAYVRPRPEVEQTFDVERAIGQYEALFAACSVRAGGRVSSAALPDAAPVDLRRSVRQLATDAVRLRPVLTHEYTAVHQAYYQAVHSTKTASLAGGTRVSSAGCVRRVAGCSTSAAATGHLLKRLSTGFEAYGYDVSPVARTRCRSIAPDAVVLEDWESQPLASFDIIVSLHTLEHLPRPLPVMERLAKKLAPGGLFFFVVPNPGGLGHRLKGRQWFAYRDPTHCSLLSRGEWVTLLRKAGFEVVSVCGDGLWDAPYVALLPTALQRVVFGAPAALQVFSPISRPFLPANWGECLIVQAEKPRPSA